MALFKCKMCGGSLQINGESVATCEYCGTMQTLPKTKDDLVSNLFNRANNLRLKCEFDKAAQIYEKILEQDDSEAEAHWGIVLCKYGIEYVEDPKTKKRIPTCHRTLFEAVTTDADYQAAIDYADPASQRIYEGEARAIDKIQKDILAIVKNEKPFDVFICYKETDENGKRTIDSSIANDIYYQLTGEGFKVFYSAITLEDKLGQEYEPYIFAALNSARVMLVIGTKPEYFSAVWVKNEWSRFLQLMKTNRSKLLIPCYRDMDAYELPEEFAHLQAQDMGKIGFINDVIRGIRKLLVSDTPKTTVAKETQPAGGANASIDSLLKRAFMFAEDGEWANANDYFEKVLDFNPENAMAYVGKLMVDLKVNRREELKEYREPFETNNNYGKAMRFADDKLRASLEDNINYIKNRNEEARLKAIYDSVKTDMAFAKTDAQYRMIAKKFEDIGDYKDAAELAKECRAKGEDAKKDDILARGKKRMNSNFLSSYRAALALFESIPGWKDADEMSVICKQRIEEIVVKEESDRLERERLQEEEFQKAKARKKLRKKIVLISIPVICVIVAFVVLLVNVIIPNGKYNNALALMNNGKYEEALSAFKALNGYKDSEEKAITAYKNHISKTLKAVKVGDSVFLGTYEQDRNANNGMEAVEWVVLERQGDKLLMLSKHALDFRAFNENGNVTWKTSDIRKWLNREFIDITFHKEEKEIIVPTVTTDCEDKVFLLSSQEAKKYFKSNDQRKCMATAELVANGVFVGSGLGCEWWLRTVDSEDSVFYVSGDGIADLICFASHKKCVRPAMWISINS